MLSTSVLKATRVMILVFHFKYLPVLRLAFEFPLGSTAKCPVEWCVPGRAVLPLGSVGLLEKAPVFA